MIENFLTTNIKINKSVNDYKKLFLNGDAPWVALGDSHTANSLKTSTTIDNLGFTSDNINSMSKKALHRTKRLKPKGIILQATPHLFSFYRISDNQEQKTNFLITTKKYMFEFLSPINRPYLTNYLKVIIKNKFAFIVDNRKSKHIEKKWFKKSFQIKNYETSTRVQLHMPILEYRDHLELKKYKNNIKHLLNIGIDVCLVRYPVSNFYLNRTRNIRIFEEVNNTFKEIAKSYNLNFVDLSKFLDEEHFANTDHITSQSKVLVTDLVKKGCKIND